METLSKEREKIYIEQCDSYYNQLVEDSTFEHFDEVFRNLFHKEKIDLDLDIIKDKLENWLSFCIDFLSECSQKNSPNALALYSLANAKMDLFNELYHEYLHDSQDISEDDFENIVKNSKFVFAKSQNGNIIFDKCLSDIERYHDEKYDRLLELLYKLKHGDISTNVEKSNILKNNVKLKGMKELKEYQVRLFYIIKHDICVVTGAAVKKVDNSIDHVNTMENLRQRGLEYLDRILTGKLNLEDEIRDSLEYYNSLNIEGKLK